ncbi:porin [Xanthomarina spongicola]|uniref:Phosphate-selective porin O/P n=1 Tax=Xanthomarina spongicola TaxID=570520 RepID=A0A316DS77_9FLAO|nr:porin [Xanthomarina spongicola]PWK20815.1 phosphate-selective porin O/P [Xanthomarina spongicola]
MKFKATLLILLFAVIFKTNAQETKPTKFGKGIVNIVGKDSSFTMKIGARIQILGTAAWENKDGELVNPYSNMLIRRARLKFDGFAFSPNLIYKIELGFSNRDMSGSSLYTRDSPRIILDAVMKWNFHENFVLWFGQAKLPGNRERVISSANLQFVDRSILNAGFNIDRDIGVQLRHHINLSDSFVMREIVAISQGEGRNITEGNQGGFQYTGRLEFLPFGTFPGKEDYKGSDLLRIQTPKLAIGATYDFNNNAVRTRSNMGSFMITDDGLYETNISTVFVDAIFKYKGISFMGEYAYRDAEDPIVKNLDGTPTGQTVQVGNAFNLQSGYLFKKNWELSGRYSNVNYNQEITGKGLVQEYTLGASKYIVGHNLKVQSDLTYIDNEIGNGGLAYRLQFEMQF